MKFLKNKVYRKTKNAGTELANKQVLSRSGKCNKTNEKGFFYTMPKSEGVFDSDSDTEFKVRERYSVSCITS